MLLTREDKMRDAALKIRKLDDIDFPVLKYWNEEPCENHFDVGPQADCIYRACGGPLFSHQRVGASWLYMARKGLLADDPGLGKTNEMLALIALLVERSELNQRALLVVQTPSVLQWIREARRWVPRLEFDFVTGSMTKAQRLERYAMPWQVLVVGHHIATRDKDVLLNLGPFSLFASDDVDPLLREKNVTHKAIVEISAGAERVFTMNATSLQTQASQLHAALVPAGANVFLGSLDSYLRRYIAREPVHTQVGLRPTLSFKDSGWQNLDDLKERIAPYYLRRKVTDVSDIRMPLLMPPTDVWLEMSMAQRTRYRELQTGILTLQREEGTQVKHLTALTKFTYGQQICAGLPALGEPDIENASPKLDWIIDKITGVWQDRKIIVYVKNVGTVRALAKRADLVDVGTAIVWGQKQSPALRQEQIARFWDDPDCRMLIGTPAMERSLNLQVASTLVNLDIQLNPARVRQVLGRIQRAGSVHEHVWMFNLLMEDTQEQRYMEVLQQRQNLFDAVFEEDNQIFGQFTSVQLLNMITGKTDA